MASRSKMTEHWNKIKKAIGIILAVVIVAAVLLAIATSLINRTRNRPTFFFGHSMLWVETGSMEPAIPARSYILVKQADGESIEEGTIITFLCNDPTSAVYGRLITHRVIEKTTDGYKTQGDNSNPDRWTVAQEDIFAVYVENLPIMTVCGRIFASPMGLVLILAVFLGSCVFLYIPDVIRAFRDESKIEAEKEKEIARRVEEEVKKMQQRDKSGVDQ